ncbi:mucin-like glycoprotein [Trypanosoma rangeli]|uniref:Mucin-like glycoprotein n=1 Tax=Trypanosoma rangeli TaxID=5698 RepID=A0A422N584_TRYRA|nr:mucin-like glycoprotein [Trypanosoma rangeli]RNF00610.1 mucin-like glycoprotein [Trypanosoma rangeli]|eukprot:RNF00610.1 mucin-like glycoprotein [Trypanosoma rangeli]
MDQPTATSDSTLLPPPPIPQRMAMATVRCRAVCALAVLALLCGCCSTVCEEVAPTIPDAVGKVWLQVEVSCRRTDEELRWRLSGETVWQTCATVTEENVELLKKDCGWLCDSAAAMYNDSNCAVACATAAAGSDAVAFAMRFATDGKSDLYKRAVNASSRGTSLSGNPGICTSKATDQTTAEPTVKAPDRVGAAPTQQLQKGQHASQDAGGTERRKGASTMAQEPAPKGASAGVVGGSPAQGTGGESPAAAGGRPNGVTPEPNVPKESGFESTQNSKNGARGQTDAAERSEEGGGAERQTAEDGSSDWTDPAQPFVSTETIAQPQPPTKSPEHTASATRGESHAARPIGATQALVHNTTAKSNVTGNIVTNSSDGSGAITTPFVPTSLLLLLLVAALARATG